MFRQPCTCSSRSLSISSTRSIHAPASLPPLSRIPKPRAPFDSPTKVLKASKRNLEQYSTKFESFESLFSKTSQELRDEIGMTVKESRYFLNILEKYRQGFNPDQIAVEEKPKKTIRGWGPRVQNGIRVR
ncbi:hypothetical protein JCM3765_007010 [Sporobolomyces pararoseus]